MSRAKEFEEVLNAAEVWKQRCLLGAGSLFTDQALWTRKNFDELYKLYVDNPDESEGKFLEKLKRQLDPGSPDAKCLWAEMAWVYQLTQGPESLKPATKRDRIARIWGWSGRVLPESHELLSDSVLGAGRVRTGVGWNTDAWLGYVFFVDAMRNWFSQRENERQQLLREPWKLMSWLDATEYAAKRMFRHALLFLLFPDDFEPTVSTKDKVSIVNGLRPRHDFDTSNAGAIDRALREIRKGLEEEHPGFSFYSSPIKERWKGGTPNPTPAPKPGSSPKPTYTADDVHKDVFVPRDDFDRFLKSIQSRKNLILQGPPGTGKTFVARRIARRLIKSEDSSRIEMVQFHQSYAYEDFVQGYRPTDNGGFELKDGVFHRFSQLARKSKAPHVFLIDEINRGNLSRIFGELLMLIEADKRSDEYAIALTYSDRLFHVPANVYILGMMNTADRSLAVVDYALRRRFAFETLKPAFATDYGREQFKRNLEAKGATPGLIARISDRIGQLNKKISNDKELGEGFQIGHSYFVPSDDDKPSDDWYRHIVDTQIAPLLREYWFDSPKDVETEVAKLYD
ncbi:MAG: AAA family ATPase [Gammaproteobacteria bacterium]|nr:AAA family ATPase [Gammaproteobacteria bacterium]MDE0274229.1 AAA family ATPase [Gammaproteobacteria bacterium]